MRIAVVGASGFIGSAVEHALAGAGTVIPLAAPRLGADPDFSFPEWLRTNGGLVDALGDQFAEADVVINAAGLATATSHDLSAMLGANALLPRVIREAATRAGCGRFVHISSAGVQGRVPVLSEDWSVQPMSAYTASKAQGEQLLRDCPDTIVYRPTSVHGIGRDVSASLARIARSRFASVAAKGENPTPQVLVENVASACAFLALDEAIPDGVVLHPAEGLTTGGLLRILGGREPRHVPRFLASAAINSGYAAARVRPSLTGHVRRVEMLWLGQDQQEGWLASRGWVPVRGPEGWQELSTWAAERH